MTEDQYRTLCAFCDSALVAEDSTFERIAITWLHVIREHPVFLKQYEDIFLPATPVVARFIKYWRLALVDFARSVRAGWRYVRSSRKKWYGNLPSGMPVDFVFVSHLLDLSHLSDENDFYFGNVPIELIRQGKSVLIVLINHKAVPGDEVERYLSTSIVPRIVISSLLSPKEEFRLWRRTVKEAGKLKYAASREISKLRRAVLSRAAVEVSAYSTKTSLRVAGIVGEIISHSQAKTVATTYEGHPWERLVYATARESSPGIRCIGYQHAALFRLQHAAKRSLGKKYDPDTILCAGPVGLNQLRNNGSLFNVHLGILGSNRSIKNLSSNGVDTCLVLPEGIDEECEILFAFSNSCALANPEVHFVWRLHPILALDKLVRRIPELKRLPSNIEVSTRSFEEDILQSTWVLYRGSTAAITAAANGVVPIYLERPGELTVDPLYEISHHRPSVSTVEEFSAALGWNKWTDESRRYCELFYAPLDSDVLTKI